MFCTAFAVAFNYLIPTPGSPFRGRRGLISFFFFVKFLFLMISSDPPSCFSNLHIHLLCAGRLQEILHFRIICFICALDHHYKQVVGSSWMKMMLLYEWSQVTQVTKCKHHTYRRE